MKRFTLNLMIGISTLTLCACEGSLIDAEPIPELSVAGEQTLSTGGFLFPEGTSVSLAGDKGRERIHFELPEGHYMVGRVEASFSKLGGEVLKVPGGDITCRCPEGSGGCTPFHAQGPDGEIWGCVLDGNCSECVGARSRMMPVEGEWVRVPFEETAIVDLAAGISTVVTKEQEAGLRCASAVLFEDPEVQAGLERYLKKHRTRDVEQLLAAQSRDELPESYQMVPLNVYGNLVWVPIERGTSFSAWMSELVWEAAETPGGGSCSCSEGGGSCTHQRRSVPFLGYAEWCESNGCSACTLHG